MAKRRRTLLSKTKRTADRAQPREAAPPTPLDPVLETVPDPANPTLTPLDSSAPESDAASFIEPPPTPNLSPEVPVAAPAQARDMAESTKAVEDPADLFSKDTSTSNDAVEAVASFGDTVFPKNFEDGDDWFTRTGQPAPPRVAANEVPDEPIVTLQSNPWPLLLGGLALAGSMALLGILALVFF